MLGPIPRDTLARNIRIEEELINRGETSAVPTRRGDSTLVPSIRWHHHAHHAAAFQSLAQAFEGQSVSVNSGRQAKGR